MQLFLHWEAFGSSVLSCRDANCMPSPKQPYAPKFPANIDLNPVSLFFLPEQAGSHQSRLPFLPLLSLLSPYLFSQISIYHRPSVSENNRKVRSLQSPQQPHSLQEENLSNGGWFSRILKTLLSPKQHVLDLSEHLNSRDIMLSNSLYPCLGTVFKSASLQP